VQFAAHICGSSHKAYEQLTSHGFLILPSTRTLSRRRAQEASAWGWFPELPGLAAYAILGLLDSDLNMFIVIRTALERAQIPRDSEGGFRCVFAQDELFVQGCAMYRHTADGGELVGITMPTALDAISTVCDVKFLGLSA
jgi:hypothetical protein